VGEKTKPPYSLQYHIKLLEALKNILIFF